MYGATFEVTWEGRVLAKIVLNLRHHAKKNSDLLKKASRERGMLSEKSVRLIPQSSTGLALTTITIKRLRNTTKQSRAPGTA